jgi:hypothetical protein
VLELGGCIVTRGVGELEVRVPKGKDAGYVLELAVGAGQQIRHLAPLAKTLERAFLQTLENAGKGAAEGAAGDSGALAGG